MTWMGNDISVEWMGSDTSVTWMGSDTSVTWMGSDTSETWVGSDTCVTLIDVEAHWCDIDRDTNIALHYTSFFNHRILGYYVFLHMNK